MFFTYLLQNRLEKQISLFFKDVKEIDLNSYTDEYIVQIAETVFSEYEKLGGNGKVAKGSDLIDDLVSLFPVSEERPVLTQVELNVGN